ncbi:leucine-rich repeat receptor-like protein kinase PEPR1 isoform X2 [Bidens hawaiensis]|uniref:leucine-rich repeat receptor-like protein kinase PEPR1 isoform X2 n=1 Tax=Bidens hawaiensis TaxID=980011 RepID=UPI00404B55DA
MICLKMSLRLSGVMVPLAYALTTDSAYLLYEFADKGNLFDVLQGSLGSCLDWTNRYSIALGVANGLAYLHGLPAGPILLLDLSSKVVMIKSLNEPQIGDIELYKVIDPSKSTGNLSDVGGFCWLCSSRICLHDEGDNGRKCV